MHAHDYRIEADRKLLHGAKLPFAALPKTRVWRWSNNASTLSLDDGSNRPIALKKSHGNYVGMFSEVSNVHAVRGRAMRGVLEDLEMPDQGTIKFCWDKEFFAFGTKYLFDWQAISLRRKLKLLSWSALSLRMLCASREQLAGMKKNGAVEGARQNFERLNDYLTSGR